ncbi:MAG: MBOAT family O-acyltransferase [Lishizhenia sp.]
MLLVSSILFYAWGAPLFIFILLISTIIDFYLVQQLHNSIGTTRKKWLLLSLFMNLGLLTYFKYANFFIDNFNQALNTLGIEQIAWVQVALPIGISFYTFQTLTYSIDVYRKNAIPQQKLSNYVLYIMLFPQMIAGPIVRYNTIAKELEQRNPKADDRLIGVYRFCVGLAKKVLIANVLGAYVDQYMGTLQSGFLVPENTLTAWLVILAYTFQIYFDFSGYSDMAIGLGRILGFSFPENFNMPYISKSITDFWRRWHITLGDFMKNYLYIPLGGNKGSKALLYRNLVLVFLLSGLWHGASWNFIFWGCFHGLFLVLERLFLNKIYKRIGSFSILITFLIVMHGWVVFKIEDIDVAFQFWQKLWDFSSVSFGNYQLQFITTLCIAFIFCFFGLFPLFRKAIQLYTAPQFSVLSHTLLICVSGVIYILSLSFILSSDFNPFIYYRF